MRVVNKYYGYPVISNEGDDFKERFTLDVDSVRLDSEEAILIKLRIQMENQDILNLISKGQAMFTIHLEESKTCFREIVQFNEFEHDFKIPLGKIREKVEVCGFITTTQEIKKFKSESMHDFYRDIDINFEPYQIIGISTSSIIEVIKEEDEIKEPKSIFAIIANKDEDAKEYKLEWSESRIIIQMPTDDYSTYARLAERNRLSNQTQDILLASVVMPVIVETLNELKSSSTHYVDKLWYKSIIQTFKDKKIDFEKILTNSESDDFDSYYYSQVLFEGIYGKAFNQVFELLKMKEAE